MNGHGPRERSTDPEVVDQAADQAERHLVRVGTLRFGLSAGVDVQAYCGAWVTPWNPDEEPGQIVEIGGLFPVYLQRDCPDCVRVHTEIAETRWEQSS